MADVSTRLHAVRESPREYAWIARMWVRSSFAYPLSFWILTVSSALITLLDFVGLALMFHTVPRSVGFGLRELALLYGASGIGIGVADLVIGSVEQVGLHVRTGTLDSMLTRPVPLLVQICADRFAIRRLGPDQPGARGLRLRRVVGRLDRAEGGAGRGDAGVGLR